MVSLHGTFIEAVSREDLSYVGNVSYLVVVDILDSERVFVHSLNNN